MLIDQDAAVAETVEAILGGRGHQVKPVKNGSEAKAFVQKETFDLIVADVLSAEGDEAAGFAEWLCVQQPSLAKRLIWICAVVPGEGPASEMSRYGCQILQKPFKPADLLLAVEAALSDGVQVAPVEG